MLPNWLYGKSLKKLQEILNSGGQTAENVSYSNTDSGLEATNAQDAIDEVAEDVTALSSSLPKVIDSGRISENSSKTFTCTDYYGYRLSIYSIGGNSMGMFVLFGKHPSVENIAFAKFNCDSQAAWTPTVSASGNVLTITTTTNSCFYTIERIA